MNPLLEQFVIESRDFLDSIAQGLLTLERDPRDSAAIDELFRAVHTLKGNSGLFAEYSAFTHLVHALADARQHRRRQSTRPPPMRGGSRTRGHFARTARRSAVAKPNSGRP
ncbi:MAG: hypothetical protein EBT54_00540 [Betaproteobacteria bacterium]|nr:hypothetical protein [Betaproteobacteria bacterium]